MNSIEVDLKQCLKMISADWKMQNNYNDKNTNFIYKATTLEQCLNLIDINNADKDYALHRWYNYMTSVAVEHIFCDYGAIHETNIYNHDVDIYINDIPFDVKLTIYPSKLSDRLFDLRTRQGKNNMIDWYYKNQSQQSRKQILNRLYVVCDGINAYECLKMKSDFELLHSKIRAFMEHALKQGVNKITIIDNGVKYNLYSDIIYITYD